MGNEIEGNGKEKGWQTEQTIWYSKRHLNEVNMSSKDSVGYIHNLHVLLNAVMCMPAVCTNQVVQ